MEWLRAFGDFYKEMTGFSSRCRKIQVLEKYKDEPGVKFVLSFVFSPYVTTGISKKKFDRELSKERLKFRSLFGLLSYVAESRTGRDEVIQQVQAFYDEVQGEDLKELFRLIVIKNVQLGVDTLTINKVIPNLIPTFNVQLANKYFDKPEVVCGKRFTLTTKIDGGRIVALKKDGVVKFYTRAGQEYEGLVDLEQELSSKFPDNLMLDGEITLLHDEGLDNKQTYKQTMMITRKLGEKHGIKMRVFDMMTADEFLSRDCKYTYEERREKLESMFRMQTTFFKMLPVLYSGDDTSMITTILEEQTRRGEEGVMININDAMYCFGRSNSLLKVKKMKDLDLTVVGLEEGNNQNAGKLGAFLVMYKGCTVRVGTGISKELREKIWENKDDYVGRTIIVQYFEETTNQEGGVSLRFPVFVDFRDDK